MESSSEEKQEKIPGCLAEAELEIFCNTHFEPEYPKTEEEWRWIRELDYSFSIKERRGQDPDILSNSSLKRNLIKYGFKKYECEICKIKEWQNRQISLQLDHIDGNKDHFRLPNLRLLCPNCHSQTKTFGSRNHQWYTIAEKETKRIMTFERKKWNDSSIFRSRNKEELEELLDRKLKNGTIDVEAIVIPIKHCK